MKILILGMMGAGKSTLAYEISRAYRISRLNLDEICRDKNTGGYYTEVQRDESLFNFISNNDNWVMEGIWKDLYSKVAPDIIIYIKMSRLTAAYRFTKRFFQAKHLIGKQIDEDLPVQAYHYRKPTIKKIYEWDQCNRNIKKDIEDFVADKTNCIILNKSCRLEDLFILLNDLHK